MIVSSNRTTSWNTWAKSTRRASGSTVETSTPPMLTTPSSASQKRAASLAAVDLPPPLGPTKAVTSPSFATNETFERTFSPPSYEKVTLSKEMS